MNVKRNFSTRSSKDLALRELSQNSQAAENRPRGKIGEEIRKKLKISNALQSATNQPEKENQGANRPAYNGPADKKNSGLATTKPQFPMLERVPMVKRPSEIEAVSSCRSSKSVRFSDKFEEVTIKRKSSASSILKNGSVMKRSILSDRGSLNNSICSNILREDQSSENLTVNKAIKDKYDRLYSNLKKTDKRYCDELYPPVWSSLSRINSPALKNIRWKRISDLFPGKYLTLWDSNTRATIAPGQYSKSRTAANCLNTVKHNNFLLEKLFESQNYNSNGIYYVKINQNNSWKYVIVDDYIPVCLGADGKTDESAFLVLGNLSATQVQIWPLILQKAYAKYYSTYQCLEKGNESDFIQQITGCPLEQLPVSPASMGRIRQELQNFDSILFARHKNQRIYPLIPRREAITVEDPYKGYQPVTIASDQQFVDSFESVNCIFLHKYFYSGYCSIKFNPKNETEEHISLRSIRVEEHTECAITVAQKDSKHYTDNYKYIWIRMLLIMKESDKNYRWIGGVYKNCKNARLSVCLEPGEYYIVLIPEWEGNKGFDYNVIFHGNTKCVFERKPFKGNEHVITEAAMDVAQRNGILKQLNQNICTYSFIERNVGFIIENINNERPNGHVRVLRSIEGLQRGKKLIQAFNKEFKNEATIEVKIEALDHFTVVLGVIGGINHGFLDQFDFGS